MRTLCASTSALASVPVSHIAVETKKSIKINRKHSVLKTVPLNNLTLNWLFLA